jgi:hypothetical protein
MRPFRRSLTAGLAVSASVLVVACSSGDPLAVMSASQIAGQAIADLRAASSVHISGQVTQSGETDSCCGAST